MNRKRYRHEDFAITVRNAILANSEVKEVRKGLEFRAWWRGGDDWSCVFFADTGAWSDVVDPPDKGNAAALARRMNLSLGGFMERFTEAQPDMKPRPLLRRGKKRPTVQPEVIERTWQQLLLKDHPQKAQGGCRRQKTIETWLNQIRGLPVPAIVSCRGWFAGADLSTLPPWPSTLRSWIERILRSTGEALVAPLRGADDGRIRSLTLRFLDPPAGAPKMLSLPLPQTVDGGDEIPIGFGHAKESLQRVTVVLTEGLMDTLASIALASRGDVANIGAISAGEMNRWGSWLEMRRKTAPQDRIVVVYHLDEPRDPGGERLGVGPDSAVRLVEKLRRARLDANLFDWSLLVAHLEAVGCPPHELDQLNDLADVVKLCAISGVGWSDLQSAFAAACGREVAQWPAEAPSVAITNVPRPIWMRA